MAPQFVGINLGGLIDLQSIKGNDAASDNVFISTLDEIGAKIDTYSWVNWYGDNGDESCWIDANTLEKAEGVKFMPGQALWVEGTDSDQMIQTAGQVGTVDIVIELQYGNTLAGNCTPVTLDLQDILANDAASDNVFISTLDEIGAKIDTYSWVNWYGDNGDESCWIDANTLEKAEGVTFEPGAGLWVEGTDSDQEITIPGVEL